MKQRYGDKYEGSELRGQVWSFSFPLCPENSVAKAREKGETARCEPPRLLRARGVALTFDKPGAHSAGVSLVLLYER